MLQCRCGAIIRHVCTVCLDHAEFQQARSGSSDGGGINSVFSRATDGTNTEHGRGLAAVFQAGDGMARRPVSTEPS